MAFTSRLGITESQLGRIVLGSVGGIETNVDTFGVDAVIRTTATNDFEIDAVVQTSIATSFEANALIAGAGADVISLDAVIQGSVESSFAFDSILRGEQAGSFVLDATRLEWGEWSDTSENIYGQIDASVTFDAVVQALVAGSFSVNAEVSSGETVTRADLFSINGVVVAPATQHSRTDDHFGEQMDSVVLYGGETLDIVLRRLYGQIGALLSVNHFSIKAHIAGTPSPLVFSVSETMTVESWIAMGSSFTVSAIAERLGEGQFGVSAYLI